jgi:hypothetical protein
VSGIGKAERLGEPAGEAGGGDAGARRRRCPAALDPYEFPLEVTSSSKIRRCNLVDLRRENGVLGHSKSFRKYLNNNMFFGFSCDDASRKLSSVQLRRGNFRPLRRGSWQRFASSIWMPRAAAAETQNCLAAISVRRGNADDHLLMLRDQSVIHCEFTSDRAPKAGPSAASL